MGKRRDLSLREKVSIKILKGLGINNSKIAESLDRHKSTISRYLTENDENRRVNCGRKRVLNDRSLRRVSRIVDKEAVSANYLVKSLDLKCTSPTLRTAIKKNSILWQKSKSVIHLSKKNKNERIKFARQSISDNIQWNNIIFSDEKRFCMDGVQNIMYGWAKKNKKHVIMKRHSGGGSIMVWVAVSFNSKSEIIVINNKLNSQGYINVLKDGLLPLITENDTFQQDNAPIHVSKVTKDWLITNNILSLEWPARSPDLNIVENVWAEMSRKVYENGKQYNTVSELKNAVLNSWSSVNRNYIQSLYKSMSKRL